MPLRWREEEPAEICEERVNRQSEKILVVADDLTGAAELAGVGLRYGMLVALGTCLPSEAETDLTVIDTKSRSLSEENAVRALDGLARQIHSSKRWDLIYKKTDSVLRGHVKKELESLLEGLGIPAALLIPANPSFGRTIQSGRYFLGGVPLHNTDFRQDPEYPRTTDDVLALLNENKVDVHYLPCGGPLPGSGVAIAEAKSAADLRLWARHVTHSVLPAGGAEFFQAILEATGRSEIRKEKELFPLAGKKVLLICGTASSYSHGRRTEWKRAGLPVLELQPDDFLDDASGCRNLPRWVDGVREAFARKDFVVAGVALPVHPGAGPAHRIAEGMALVFSEVIRKEQPEELLIEGGATATVLFEHLNWSCFQPLEELAMGVTRLCPKDRMKPVVTLKPGSYPWPDQLLFPG